MLVRSKTMNPAVQLSGAKEDNNRTTGTLHHPEKESGAPLPTHMSYIEQRLLRRK